MSQILILGATSDIAQAAAGEFARHGFNVVLGARNADRLSRMQSDLKIRYKVDVRTVEFDASRSGDHAKLVPAIKESDVVLCAFGYLGDQVKSRTDWEEANQMLTANFTGAVSILNVVADVFQQKGSGVIIGISSVAGDRGRGSNYIYGSAKAGFTAYLSGLRNHLFKHKVHVLTVQPGFVRTKMTEGLPLPKPLTATPEKVATDIYKAFKKRSNTLYSLWMWRWIMLIIKLIPEPVFKKMKL
jgi:decaprenylphospho-beta-D-erythro-pentofuranosid-2-ulose 2-reductase